MPDLPSFADLQAVGRAEMLARSARLTPEVLDRDGSDANALNAASAAMNDQVVGQLALILRDGFIGTAVGPGLRKLVWDRYRLAVKEASAAYGEVQFATTAPAAGAFTINAGTRLSTSDGTEYETLVTVVFPALSTGPIAAPVRSVLAGAGVQAAAGTIANIIGQIAGQPADLTVTNALATAGAGDAETENSVRERALGYYTTLRRGTLSAVLQGALATPGVEKARVFEYLGVVAQPNGRLQVVVTDAFTDALVAQGVNPPAYQTQAQTLGLQVRTVLQDYVAAGVAFSVFVAQVVLITQRLSYAVQAGFDPAAVDAAVRAAAVNYCNSLRPGAVYDPAAVKVAVDTVEGVVPGSGLVLSPTVPIVPAALQVLRTTLGLASTGA